MVPSYEYSIYGITLTSEVMLDLPQRSGKGFAAIELRLDSSESMAEAIAGARLSDRSGWFEYAHLDDGSTYVRWKGVGEFLAHASGTRILCAPAPEASLESFQVYLLGQALSLAITKAGFEPLHGTAIDVSGNAIAFIGESGQGKSTIAASFLSAGARLLTDDLMLVSGGECPLQVYPGPARIKLRSDSAGYVLGPAATGVPMNPESSKHILPIQDSRRIAVPCRLRVIYALAPTDTPDQDIAIDLLSERERFLTLVAATLNRYASDPARRRRQMLEIARITRSIPVKRLRYPHAFAKLAEVREALLVDSDLRETNAG